MSIDQDNFLASLPSDWMFDRFKDVAALRSERTGEASEVEDYLELGKINGKSTCHESTINERSTCQALLKGTG